MCRRSAGPTEPLRQIGVKYSVGSRPILFPSDPAFAEDLTWFMGVCRVVNGKYAQTDYGTFELRYFFSESVNGPEGEGTSLLILKRRVKKLIEEENPAKPLTDDQITRILQSQGIQVTRRTVAKYREDMRIPSTHQRRVKN